LADEVTSTETSTTEATALNDAPVADVATSEIADEGTALGAAAADGDETDLDAAAAEAGEGEEAADKPVVPEAYELAVSEGFELDPAMVAEATPIFQEIGLTNDQAQQLMPVAEKFAQSIIDRNNQAIMQTVTAERAAWLNDAKADEEIGGSKWDDSIVTAAKALDQLGFTKGSAFRSLLDDSGMGNHPEMIRAWTRIGRAISEDSDFVRGGVATTGARTAAHTLYPPKS